MKTKQLWISASKVGGSQYKKLHNYISSVAGDGEIVSAESLGVNPDRIMFPNAYLILAHNQWVVYSLSDTGEHCVDLIGEYHKPA